jgi:hypothetical protein
VVQMHKLEMTCWHRRVEGVDQHSDFGAHAQKTRPWVKNSCTFYYMAGKKNSDEILSTQL